MDKVLAQLAAQIDKLGTAAWDQAPLVYRDIIVAGLVRHGLGLVLGLLLLLVAAWCIKRSIVMFKSPVERCKHCLHRPEDPAWAFVFGAAAATILGMTIVSMDLPTLLTAWLAPRAYLIDYLR